MTLLAMLLTLLAERLLAHWRDAEDSGVRARLRRLLPAALLDSASGLLVLAVIAGIAAGALANAIEVPLLRLLFDVLVLFVCLGPRDLAADLRALLAARAAGDDGAVARLTARLSRCPDTESGRPDFIGALFVLAHERLFAVLLWFIVLGPGGALFYRLLRVASCSAAVTPGTSLARSAHMLAAFVPARVTALLLALAGSSDDALRAWRHLPPGEGGWNRNWTLLADVGNAALMVEERGAAVVPGDLDAALREVLRLQDRALLLLLALAALYTAGAWLA
jgi:Membrane protein required for beta-lactamase induction